MPCQGWLPGGFQHSIFTIWLCNVGFNRERWLCKCYVCFSWCRSKWINIDEDSGRIVIISFDDSSLLTLHFFLFVFFFAHQDSSPPVNSRLTWSILQPAKVLINIRHCVKEDACFFRNAYKSSVNSSKLQTTLHLLNRPVNKRRLIGPCIQSPIISIQTPAFFIPLRTW